MQPPAASTSTQGVRSPLGDRAAQLEALTRANTDDLLVGLGLERARRGRRLLERLLRAPAVRFAGQVAAFDDRVGSAGLAGGGAWVVEQFVERLVIAGAEQ